MGTIKAKASRVFGKFKGIFGRPSQKSSDISLGPDPELTIGIDSYDAFPNSQSYLSDPSLDPVTQSFLSGQNMRIPNERADEMPKMDDEALLQSLSVGMSDMVFTPFNCWPGLISFIAGLGVTRDKVDSRHLERFIEKKSEVAFWYDPRAVYIFKRQREAYQAGIDYIDAAADYIAKRRYKDKGLKLEIMKWEEVAMLDFRLQAIVRHLQGRLDKLKLQKGYYQLVADTQKVFITVDLMFAIEDLVKKVQELRKKLVFRIVKKDEEKK